VGLHLLRLKHAFESFGAWVRKKSVVMAAPPAAPVAKGQKRDKSVDKKWRSPAFRNYGYGGLVDAGDPNRPATNKLAQALPQEPEEVGGDWLQSGPAGVDPSLLPTVTPGGPPGYLDRPARKQAAGPVTPTHSGFYNLWYHRISGDYDFKDRPKRSNAPSARCNIKRDAGRTKGDSMQGAWLCLYFARGQCHLGPDCAYLHRRPTDYDDARLDMMHDVFGRGRHMTDRDDMGGVGSFSRENRTLYIGGLRNARGGNIEEDVIKAFAEWGDLEHVRVIGSKSIAFVRYRLRAGAEFAKEAMADSSFGHDEVLNIRWANEDPNPSLKRKVDREMQEKGADAILQKWADTTMWQHMMPNQQSYPQNDHQYDPEQQQQMDPAVVAAAWQQYYAAAAAAAQAAHASSGGEAASEGAGQALAPPQPAAAVDEQGARRHVEPAPAGVGSDVTKSLAQMINSTAKKQKTGGVRISRTGPGGEQK
jgi:hypothetical protein